MIRAAASSSAPVDDCATSFAARIGQNLMQARAALGVSQELVSDLAALHRTAFGQLERRERISRADTLVKLPAALQVEPQSRLAGLIWVPPTVRAGRFGVAPWRRFGRARRRDPCWIRSCTCWLLSGVGIERKSRPEADILL